MNVFNWSVLFLIFMLLFGQESLAKESLKLNGINAGKIKIKKKVGEKRSLLIKL